MYQRPGRRRSTIHLGAVLPKAGAAGSGKERIPKNGDAKTGVRRIELRQTKQLNDARVDSVRRRKKRQPPVLRGFGWMGAEGEKREKRGETKTEKETSLVRRTVFLGGGPEEEVAKTRRKRKPGWAETRAFQWFPGKWCPKRKIPPPYKEAIVKKFDTPPWVGFLSGKRTVKNRRTQKEEGEHQRVMVVTQAGNQVDGVVRLGEQGGFGGTDNPEKPFLRLTGAPATLRTEKLPPFVLTGGFFRKKLVFFFILLDAPSSTRNNQLRRTPSSTVYVRSQFYCPYRFCSLPVLPSTQAPPSEPRNPFLVRTPEVQATFPAYLLPKRFLYGGGNSSSGHPFRNPIEQARVSPRLRSPVFALLSVDLNERNNQVYWRIQPFNKAFFRQLRSPCYLRLVEDFGFFETKASFPFVFGSPFCSSFSSFKIQPKKHRHQRVLNALTWFPFAQGFLSGVQNSNPILAAFP
ncbi:hypothetical protein GOBAR_AA10638 [Gossypium barbadense]|uniref:Uncharacterized protein n=1 Tax=Gossypium barbadense TaxID=3634 RepID=A0A2P5Y318_GOSBA|nr:hypothetical protein GOBAR_AA10638 [Gossypium barbadense]